MNPVYNLGISEKMYRDISAVLDILNSYATAVVKTWLVGSYAQGCPREDSDIDIVVYVDSPDKSYCSYNVITINGKKISIKYLSVLNPRSKNNTFQLYDKQFALSYADWYTGKHFKQSGDESFRNYRDKLSNGELQ